MKKNFVDSKDVTVIYHPESFYPDPPFNPGEYYPEYTFNDFSMGKKSKI